MRYEIKNEFLTAAFDSIGGELVSLKGKDGTEYVWVGNPEFWSSHAPMLFPYVGRFTDGKYIMDGKEHPMKIHGHFGVSKLQVSEMSDDSITFTYEPSENPFGEYDRKYHIDLQYRLEKQTLKIRFMVKNNDSRVMYFGYGGHPGFNVPLSEGLSFEDYYLEFSEPMNAVQVGMTDACFVGGTNLPFTLQDDIRLPLKHGLFDHDAIILRDMARSVTLKSDQDTHSVTVTYPQMPYLGIWHCPKTEAPYVCIEPWVSLPSRQDIVEVFEEKSDMIILAPEKTYTNNWQITVS